MSGTMHPHNAAGAGILAQYFILLAITLALILTRLYVSFRVTYLYDWADTTILIAAGFLIVGAAFCTIEVDLGLGQHLDLLADPEYQAHQILRWNTYFQIVNVCTTLFTKYSISLYILRIRNDRNIRIILGIMMLFMTMATIAVIVVLSVSCVPLRALWDPTVKGVCLPLNTVYIVSYVQSGFTIVIDLVLTISPIVILWNVRIRKGRKTLIIFLMSLGLVATISNALRNAFVPTLTSPDFTYAIIPITILAILELCSGVIAACIPACIPLFLQRGSVQGSATSRGLSTQHTSGNRSASYGAGRGATYESIKLDETTKTSHSQNSQSLHSRDDWSS